MKRRCTVGPTTCWRIAVGCGAARRGRNTRSDGTPWAFDDWAYLLAWPDPSVGPLRDVTIVVEDIKFAMNAWLLLRSTCYFGTQYPVVMSPLANTTPTMHIAARGNRIFHNHSVVGVGPAALNPESFNVALTPSHHNAKPLRRMNWIREARGRPIRVVAGQENGLSRAVADACEAAVYIPQYGSVGSLSLNCALGVCLASIASTRHDIIMQDHQRVVTGADRGDGVAVVSRELIARRLAEAQAPSGVQTALSTLPYPSATEKAPRPHADEFLHLCDDTAALRQELALRRQWFPMQLELVWENRCSDRNIGAAFRSLNAFNADGAILLGRRHFCKRGTLGTHHYLPWRAVASWEQLGSDDAAAGVVAEASEVWVLWNDYPYIRDDWEGGHEAQRTGCHRELWCDDAVGMFEALRQAHQRGVRRLRLVVPEDGASASRDAMQRATAVLRVCRSPSPAQVGLGPAIAVTVALESIRHCIVALRGSPLL